MAKDARAALHSVHTATNDVIAGLDTMLERAQSEVRPIIARLDALHRRHADEQATRLHVLGDDDTGDGSIQGAINVVVVTVRDWLTGIDEGSLDAVLNGEEALRGSYEDAMEAWPERGADETFLLLERQYIELGAEIDRLRAHAAAAEGSAGPATGGAPA